MTTTSAERSVTSIWGSLRSRIMLLFLATTALVALLTLLTTRDATYRHSTDQLRAQHLAASRVVADRLAMTATLLQNGLTDISRSFSVKELVASGLEDPASLAAAMENYRSRLSADIYLVLDENGDRIVSDVLDGAFEADPAAFSAEGVTWYHTEGRHFLLKSAPLRFAERSRRVNAWLLMGQEVDHLVTENLVALTGMQISLVSQGHPTGIWGSSLEPEQTRDLQGYLASLSTLSTGISELNLGGKSFAAGTFAIDQKADLYSIAVLPLEEAYVNYEALLGRLILLLAAAFALAFLAAVRISGSITKPVDELVNAANSISEGRVVTEFPAHGTEEVKELSRAISDMQQGIRAREHEINRLAFFDSLTGLPNRNSFVTALDEAIGQLEDDATLFIALIDVDRFKEVNDTVGHDTGDELLKLIASRLTGAMRRSDYLARLGGDEFGIISGTAGRSAARLGEDVAAIFEQPFSIDELMLDIDVSVGLAGYPLDAQDAQGLLQLADIALYSSKGTHESYRAFHQDLNRHSVQRLNLMSELKEAIAEGQLTLYYQPKLSLIGNSVKGAECLIRWQHPTYGMVPPDDFIGLAEQTGAIRQLTQWALRAAMEQQAAWSAKGIDIAIAVNISAVDLVDMSLPAMVGELQSRFELAPGDLTIEVTESAIMDDPENAVLALKTLERMGIILSIDDFGTGFSSMAQLKQMPVHELKIDKAFVLALASNHDDQVMVRTLITLAHNLGLETVAEGVEDADALKLLAEMGCDRIQGYYLSRPLPAEDFEAWWRERQGLHAAIAPVSS